MTDNSVNQERKMLKYEALLQDYTHNVASTDMLPEDNLRPVLLGLFGEVGSVMAAAKKRRREEDAYPEYQQLAEEEFGDVLWYFVALCRRLCVDVSTVFPEIGDQSASITPIDLSEEQSLLNLGKAVAPLLDVDSLNEQTLGLLRTFAQEYVQALQTRGMSFPAVISANALKVYGRFVDLDQSSLPTFDDDFPDKERIPLHFEIRIIQQSGGESRLQWDGVFIGDPLTDNISEPDSYRFHDVFHLAHAAILHWSPTFRALIKHKRKSVPDIDRTQDSGRAIVIEEGLTAWIFSRAKQLNLFRGETTVSFDMLKTVQQFVRGYEVEACPLKLWEQAILQGYEVFRQVSENRGGIVIGNRETRSIAYRVN